MIVAAALCLWYGDVSRHCAYSIEMWLGSEVITARDHVRILGVTLSSGLSINKHISNIYTTCFHWLRQLRHVRRSLDIESAATPVHAFATSRVDYCNIVLAGTPKSTTDRLQRVLNAAARVVSETRKFDHCLSQLLHDQLHWLDILQRIYFKLCTTVHRCLQRKAPPYLVDLCKPVSDIASRQHLWSANSHYVQHYRRSMFGRPALQSGTHFQTTFETWHCHHVLSESDWKLCCSHLTSTSAH